MQKLRMMHTMLTVEDLGRSILRDPDGYLVELVQPAWLEGKAA
jgi:hypothetical protein